MATQIQRRRGTEAKLKKFIGAQGEITIDITNNRIVTHDGITPGGHPAAKQSDLEALELMAGEAGPMGPAGPQGPIGPEGPKGEDGLQGEQGPIGPIGPEGPKGEDGLDGQQGEIGPIGPMGPIGPEGLDGMDGIDGQPGQPGLSAYDVWVSEGNIGTIQDFLNSLRGQDGEPGQDGLSAYELAINNGYFGTEQDWVASLQGYGFNYRSNEWLETAQYYIGDVLSLDGTSYACKVEHEAAQNNKPTSGGFWDFYWFVLAAKGEDGQEGLQGEPGQPGEPGQDITSIDDSTISLDSTWSSDKIDDELSTLFQSVSSGKALVASAITDKGVVTDSDATFQTLATNVSLIEGEGGGVEANGETVQVIARDKLLVGDVVYTIDDGDILGLLGDRVEEAIFSPDGNSLVLVGGFIGRAKIYSVEADILTYISDIYADNVTTALSNIVNCAKFSPDGNSLVLGGVFTGRAKIYSVVGTTVTFVSNIFANTGTTLLSSTANTVAFSPNGNSLVLGGAFTGRAKIYSVDGTTITFVSDIYADTGTTLLGGDPSIATFSPNGNSLVLGGSFAGRAKVYSVSGTTITFVSDIYADNGTTALSNIVNCAKFSPDGNSLVLGGVFTGRAKIYTVVGTTITFVDNISILGGGTGATAGALSPDGNFLVLAGSFTDRAKIYSVVGTTVTFVSNIFADNENTLLSNAVRTATFSPNGNTLILGGYFTGYAKRYKVVGQNISFGQTRAKLLLDNKGYYNSIGYALENIEKNEQGDVRVLANSAYNWN